MSVHKFSFSNHDPAHIFLPNGEEKISILLPAAAWVTTSSGGDATWW